MRWSSSERLDEAPLTSAQIEWHLRCGLHSRIPGCCILFFLTDWRRKSANARQKRIQRALAWLPADRRYVVCPACLRARHFVEIHVCTECCVGIPGSSPRRKGRAL